MNAKASSRPAAPHVCVVGAQWGDEGKGKIVDALSPDFDAVVRFQGGANAGHTVLIGDEQFIFHLIPSGILQKDKLCIIGNGVVLDPPGLVRELDGLRERGIDHESNLWISDRAHIVLPYHRVLDRARDRSGNGKRLGTTLRGIGPCYTDKAARKGLRMADLIDFDRFTALLRAQLEEQNRELELVHGEEPLDLETLLEEYRAYGERLGPRVRNITELLWELDAGGQSLLFEGAQGALLDLDLGTYPYVTSSNTSFLGLGAGTGFSPRRIGTVLGIAKAYTTRVGEGPFPTEISGEAGDRLREAGGEYGATTGRPRRCGWLDLVALRYAIRFGDIDALAITKLDVLDDQERILVGTRYRGPGGAMSTTVLPAHFDAEIEVEYHEVPGWQAPTDNCRSADDLPARAREYLQLIADFTGRPIAMASVGKERNQLIRFEPWLAPRATGESAGG